MIYSNVLTRSSHFCFLVGCSGLNSDRNVMSSTYAWRPLASQVVCFHILKGSSCTNVSKDWQAYRCCALYHSPIAPIIADVNDICSTDRHFRFADKLVRRGRGFWHLLSIVGAEIAAAAAMKCDTDNCPTFQNLPMPKDNVGQYRRNLAAQDGK